MGAGRRVMYGGDHSPPFRGVIAAMSSAKVRPVIFPLIVLSVVLLLAFLPSMWVQGVLTKHQVERPDLPGTGGEFARHILDEMKLGHVAVEVTDSGDHYDPEDKVVRLSKPHFEGRSLAAVVVAAHEVGHAMQDAAAYPPLRARTALATRAARIEKLGAFVMLAGPVLMVLSRSPVILALDFLAGGVIMLAGVAMHMVTLPVEYDASFRRALPVLKAGNYIAPEDMTAAHSILRAAAFTYVASAAMSLLNVARWLRVLRF